MLTLFANWFQKTKRGAGRKRPLQTCWPRIEALEERALLTVGPLMHINTTATLDQDTPAVASQPSVNGGSVVVWRHQVDGDTNILAQRYNGAGNKLGSEITVASTNNFESAPAVAMDAQGNFVVTWVEDIVAGDTDIRAQRFFANGTTNGNGILVAGNEGVAVHIDPDVAMDAQGNFVISWVFRNTPSNRDVRAQRFDSDGNTIGSFLAVAELGINERLPSIASASDGRFSIAYLVNNVNRNDVVLKRYDTAGGLLGTHVLAASSTAKFDPDVAMDQAGNAVVVWAAAVSNVNRDIVSRKVFFNGVVAPTRTIDSSPTFESSPTVTIDQSDSDVVVAYVRQPNPTGTKSLLVRELNSNAGVKSTINLGVVATGVPALAINNSDRYFLVYTLLNGPGNPAEVGLGIYGRRGLLV